MKQSTRRSCRTATGRTDSRPSAWATDHCATGSSSRCTDRSTCAGFGNRTLEGFADATIRDVLFSLSQAIVDIATGRGVTDALELIVGIEYRPLRRTATQQQ
jgi:hypothetical protein